MGEFGLGHTKSELSYSSFRAEFSFVQFVWFGFLNIFKGVSIGLDRELDRVEKCEKSYFVTVVQ